MAKFLELDLTAGFQDFPLREKGGHHGERLRVNIHVPHEGSGDSPAWRVNLSLNRREPGPGTKNTSVALSAHGRVWGSEERSPECREPSASSRDCACVRANLRFSGKVKEGAPNRVHAHCGSLQAPPT